MRRVGIGALAQKNKAKDNFKQMGKELEELELEHMEKQMMLFSENLEKFAVNHKHQIKSNPIFRQQFQQMCKSVGIDPLASKKGYWAEMLGIGEFYFELAVQVVEICVATRSSNGGLIKVDELIALLNRKRGIKFQDQNIDEHDIRCSVDKLKCLGDGYHFTKAGNVTFLVSVPVNLNTDHAQILALADQNSFTTVREIIDKLKWTHERAESVLSFLLSEGMVWIDSQSEEYSYWFFSLFKK